MKRHLSRREFLATSAYAATGLALGLAQTSCVEEPSGPMLHKAIIVEKPTRELLKKIKDAGFDGVEAGVVRPEEAEKARRVAERSGVRIHSVLRGWAEFNSNDRAELDHSLAVTMDALYAAQAYGADNILLVPGRIYRMAMPEPWEFRIEFDKKTGHLTSVVEGDNSRYEEYIAAHNRAYESFQKMIRALMITAAKTGVVIAIENVWNNLFVDPNHMAYFVDSFQSPWVRSYFDIGNHVKYSPPEQWITVLGNRIVKCHVKDFKLNPDGHGGRFVNIREGSVNWSAVSKALKNIGYHGWMTIEGSEKLPLEERSRRLDLIIAGK